jgi:hypothetical protein
MAGEISSKREKVSLGPVKYNEELHGLYTSSYY